MWTSDCDKASLERFIDTIVNNRGQHSIEAETSQSLPDHFGVIFTFRYEDGTDRHAFELQRVSSNETGVTREFGRRLKDGSTSPLTRDRPDGKSSVSLS